MPVSLSNKKKSNKLLKLVHSYQPQTSDNQFVRSYSQLLNKHFSQSRKQQSSLRKSLSTSNALFKTHNRPSPKKIKHHPNKDKNFGTNNQKIQNQQFKFLTNNQGLDKSIASDSINPEMFGSRFGKQKLLQLNPETNLKLQKIMMSKTQIIEKNSHENVILNQKLHQSTHEKKSLMSLMQRLRMQILKQKKIKARISTNMGKLMNKIEEVNTGITKTGEEMFFIRKQTKLLQKEFQTQTRKNQQLQTISQMNNEKIQIQKQLIAQLCKDLQRNKATYFETKTHLNEIKEIYMRETKCLLKVGMHKHQSQQEMNLLCKTVQLSVANAKDNTKR